MMINYTICGWLIQYSNDHRMFFKVCVFRILKLMRFYVDKFVEEIICIKLTFIYYFKHYLLHKLFVLNKEKYWYWSDIVIARFRFTIYQIRSLIFRPVTSFNEYFACYHFCFCLHKSFLLINANISRISPLKIISIFFLILSISLT